MLTGKLSARGTLEPRAFDLDWDMPIAHFTARRSRAPDRRTSPASASLRRRVGCAWARTVSARAVHTAVRATRLCSSSTPRLEQFTPLAGGVRVRGTLTGALRNPRVALVGEADALTLPGEPSSQCKRQAGRHVRRTRGGTERAGAGVPLDITARLRGAYRARGWASEIAALRNAGAFRSSSRQRRRCVSPPSASSSVASMPGSPKAGVLARSGVDPAASPRAASSRACLRSGWWSPPASAKGSTRRSCSTANGSLRARRSSRVSCARARRRRRRAHRGANLFARRGERRAGSALAERARKRACRKRVRNSRGSRSRASSCRRLRSRARSNSPTWAH